MSISFLGRNNEISNYLSGDASVKREKLKFFYCDILNDINTKDSDNNFVAQGLYHNYNGDTKTTFAMHPFQVRYLYKKNILQ